MDLKGLEEARKLGHKYYKGKPCKEGHTKKYVTNSMCFKCNLKLSKKRYEKNRDEILECRRQQYIENPNKFKKRILTYQKNNKGTMNAIKAKRRASKILRTPDWLSKEHLEEIKEIYRTCPKGYHVDHVIPLQGRNVSGLHVPWNLQHLTAEENHRKGNRVDV